MGNRAVITTCTAEDFKESHELGVYLHWNGGRDSVEAFLCYCELQGFRKPEEDIQGWARLCQIISNYFGDNLTCVGIGTINSLDTDNHDNGTYIIKDWKIVDRRFFTGLEQQIYDIEEMLYAIDNAQPESIRLGKDVIEKKLLW